MLPRRIGRYQLRMPKAGLVEKIALDWAKDMRLTWTTVMPKHLEWLMPKFYDKKRALHRTAFYDTCILWAARMKIGCLQFAPQVGDVDNNMTRADAVLAKADSVGLETLDLLVLPEMAFSGEHVVGKLGPQDFVWLRTERIQGYNFKSLQHISPCLEPSGSGISSLWARTTALKLDCLVAVGYPEKVQRSRNWAQPPKYHSSLIMVNGDGETVAEYRKRFLHSADESWASEGKDGFFSGDVDGAGRVAIGLCMDINPYKFEAPWHAFEFAFHILEVRAHLVIVSMAWPTHEDTTQFTQIMEEPDMETLTYWVQRLEPIIRAEREEEVIVVICNRSGLENDVVYAGTSVVLGIKEGEVSVYGILGRGVKELLIVDTEQTPFAKLLHRPHMVSDLVQDTVERLSTTPSFPPPIPELGPAGSSDSEVPDRVFADAFTRMPNGTQVVHESDSEDGEIYDGIGAKSSFESGDAMVSPRLARIHDEPPDRVKVGSEAPGDCGYEHDEGDERSYEDDEHLCDEEEFYAGSEEAGTPVLSPESLNFRPNLGLETNSDMLPLAAVRKSSMEIAGAAYSGGYHLLTPPTGGVFDSAQPAEYGHQPFSTSLIAPQESWAALMSQSRGPSTDPILTRSQSASTLRPPMRSVRVMNPPLSPRASRAESAVHVDSPEDWYRPRPVSAVSIQIAASPSVFQTNFPAAVHDSIDEVIGAMKSESQEKPPISVSRLGHRRRSQSLSGFKPLAEPPPSLRTNSFSIIPPRSPSTKRRPSLQRFHTVQDFDADSIVPGFPPLEAGERGLRQPSVWARGESRGRRDTIGGAHSSRSKRSQSAAGDDDWVYEGRGLLRPNPLSPVSV